MEEFRLKDGYRLVQKVYMVEYECTTCSKQRNSHPRIIDHLNTSHWHKRLICKVCTKVFVNITGLEEHFAKSHNKPAIQCQCEGCEFSTCLTALLGVHYHDLHDNAIPEDLQPILAAEGGTVSRF